MKRNLRGFTLPELLVGLAILVFLSTIGYMKYSDYISDSRDATRFSKIREIGNLIKAYKISHTLPVPLDFIEIKARGEVIGYQGYAGPDVLEKIHYSSEGKDPSDYRYFTYYISSDRKSFALMGFYENEESLDYGLFINKTYAGKVDYKIRYPYVTGDNVGVYTDSDNVPVQEVEAYSIVGELDLTNVNKNDILKVFFINEKKYKFTGEILSSKMYSINKKGQFGDSNNCPEGYISVWGDVDFNQKGFCVAKYEMTFSELDSPGSPTNSTYNSYDYIDGKYYKSRIDYPVVNLTQEEAIEACNRLGKGYHLITNNEWMTIARQIEFEKENWKSEEPGLLDTLFLGNSNYSENGCADNTGPNDKATKTGDGDQNCFYKRKNTLFNGEIIWDFAGNVAEHVNKANTKSGSGYNDNQTSLGTSSDCYVEWNTLGDTERIQYGSLFGDTYLQGIGKVCRPSGVSNNVFIRGGAYGGGNVVGIYNLLLDKGNLGSKQNYIGFRCAR